MKKRITILFTAILLAFSICPASALAENTPVSAFSASYISGKVSYDGSATAGVKAAAVLLIAPDNSLVMIDTCEVKNDGSFSGVMNVSLTSTGTYIIKASDYEGGAFTEASFGLYSITYHLNGGINNAANPSVYSSSESITLLAPNRSGYKFTGWYGDSSFSTKITGWSAGESGDKHLYAKWRKISSPDETEEPEPTESVEITAVPTPTVTPTQTPGSSPEPIIELNESSVSTFIDQGIVRAIVDDTVLQDAIEQILLGINKGQIKPGEAVIELPQVELPSGTTQGSIEFGVQSAQMLAENNIVLGAQIGNALIDIPTTVLAQTAGTEGASSVRIVSGREESLAGTENNLFMLSGGEQGQLIGSPYSFAIELLMADGSVQTLTTFDGTVSITVKLTEQELAVIDNPNNLKMVYVNPQTGETEVLESVFDPQTGMLTFHTSHFSVFQLMETGIVVASDKSSLWWILWVGLGIALVAATGAIIYLKNKRRSSYKVY